MEQLNIDALDAETLTELIIPYVTAGMKAK
jgi:hypothetical protein